MDSMNNPIDPFEDKINPQKQVYTVGVSYEFEDHLSDLSVEVLRKYLSMPDIRTDGSNDKRFFSLDYLGRKVFVAVNELNGLTVMLPDEY